MLVKAPLFGLSGSCEIMTQTRKVNQFMTDKSLAGGCAEVILTADERLPG